MAKPNIKAFKNKASANKIFKSRKMLWDRIYKETKDKYYAPKFEKVGIYWIVSWWDF